MDALEAKEIDFLLYQHGCQVLSIEASKADFESQYQEGRFHFSQSPNLLEDLLLVYGINIQFLAGEWLASNANNSSYGKTPLKSVLQILKKLPPPK